jgi:hypothetical protein
MLSAVPFGTFTVSMVIVAVLVAALFSTILTHLSFFSYIGANAGAFLLLYSSVFLFSVLGRLVTGQDLMLSGFTAVGTAVIAALPFQIVVCAAVHFVTVKPNRRSSHFITLR